MFGTMIRLSTDGKHKEVYLKVKEYLTQHFTCLPPVEIYYDAEGKITSENRQHQIVVGGLICVRIASHGDTLGLLLENGQVELDSVCTSCIPELRRLYGYHE